MPRKSATSADTTPLEQYTHKDKQRANNPPVGLVTPDTDQDAGKKIYAYDPHLDPQLNWAGKAEHTSFALPTVSLHVHERIDPRTIIEAVRKRDELARTGIRNRGGDKLTFSRVELLSGTRWLHADAEVSEENTAGAPSSEPIRAVISFGPQHAPLEQRQVEWALEDARKLYPKPKMVIFAAFQFDPEAAKDIEETNWPGVTLLKVQMNADLLTDDLKKKRASNESFWLIGQPDVVVKRIAGAEGATHQVEVLGFDYYDTRKGEIVSGGTSQIALWMLDTDYDGRSLLPRQVFFPLAGEKDGWARLAKNLKAEIDEELIEAYRGTKSLPFKPGARGRIAVKIVDDRGIESFKVIEVM